MLLNSSLRKEMGIFSASERKSVTELHFHDCPYYCIVKPFSQWSLILGRRTARRTLLATGQSTSENNETDLIIWALEVTLYLIISSFDESDDSSAESMSYYTSSLITKQYSNFAKVFPVNISFCWCIQYSSVQACVSVFQVPACVFHAYVILMSWIMCVNHLQGCWLMSNCRRTWRRLDVCLIACLKYEAAAVLFCFVWQPSDLRRLFVTCCAQFIHHTIADRHRSFILCGYFSMRWDDL